MYAKALKGRRDKMYLGFSWYQEEMRGLSGQAQRAKKEGKPKRPGWITQKLIQALDNGFKKTGLDYVDVWRITCHEQSGRHEDYEMEEMCEALAWAKKTGRARFTGISSHDRPHIKKWIQDHKDVFDVIVTPYSAKTKMAGVENVEETESGAGWHMEVEHRPGPKVLAGSLPDAGIDLQITDPWGNSVTVASGSKPEHGFGGFEVLAPHIATYTLSFLNHSFKVEMRGQSVFVTFTETEAPPPIEPPVEPPVEPPAEPPTEPPVEPPPAEPPVDPLPIEPPVEPPVEPEEQPDDRWAQLFEKLEQIEKLIARLPKE